MASTGATQIDAAFAVDFAGRLQAAMEAGDVAAIVALATDDVVYDDMGAANAIEGKPEFARLLKPIYGATEDLKFSLEGTFVAVDGESLAARWHVTGRRVDQDASVDIEFMTVYEMRDGKVCRWTSIFRHMDWLGHIWP